MPRFSSARLFAAEAAPKAPEGGSGGGSSNVSKAIVGKSVKRVQLRPMASNGRGVSETLVTDLTKFRPGNSVNALDACCATCQLTVSI
jgi:hypothetical protein